MDAFKYLREKTPQIFDFIYIAPPQYRSIWEKAMATLDENPGWTGVNSTVIVQIHPKEFIDQNTYANFMEFDRRSYGDTMLIFLNGS
jgi:16S rRNA (guanine966-N2)-methyltransferase